MGAAVGSQSWKAIIRQAAEDGSRPRFVSRLAAQLASDRSRVALPGGVSLTGIRRALEGLEPIPTHRTDVASARALLDARSWSSADMGRGAQMRDVGVLGTSERSTGIGYVAIHLRDVRSGGELATPASAAGYGDVRLWFTPDTLRDMTVTPRQHHEMRPGDAVTRGTVESLHRIYAQRLIDWTAMGGPAPAATRDALRGWLLQHDQQAWFLLEGQARGLRGSKVRAVELLPGGSGARAGYDELIATAKARGIEVIDRRLGAAPRGEST